MGTMTKTEEVEKMANKYPDVPYNILLKTNLLRRGVAFTREASERIQDPEEDYEHRPFLIFQIHQRDSVEEYNYSLVMHFNDGTETTIRLSPPEFDPYLVDLVEDKFWLFDDGEPLVEVWFPKSPAHYKKKTSRGTPMKHVACMKGQDCIFFIPYRHCHYFNDGDQCAFCDMDYNLRLQMKMGRGFKTRVDPEDTYETAKAVLTEKGRYRSICVTGGSDPRNDYQAEFEYNRDAFKAIKRAWEEECPGQEVKISAFMTPFKKDQMWELKEAGLAAYSSDLEVWDPDLFPYICPGKHKHMGRDEWIKRTIDSVEIFGEGNVAMEFVTGVEMVPPPYGFGDDLDRAVNSIVESYSFLIDHGIVPISTNWCIEPGTVLYNLGYTQPPLELFVKTDRERYLLSKERGAFAADFRDYREDHFCAFSDWARLL